MLLMVVIKACETSIPYDGWDGRLACFPVAMNTLFSSFDELCSKFKVI
jgi:hypothetical protein